ncbi:glycosyltransferase family 2 protein [Methanothrix thermoacetophila]|uniref:Glycosyl transferase, family 2 n=1 Tax=Methanothrix thermoacetophila (strain DSM 6194 / JCM 14653 / NBRC 101360 / PT) TaxID=349307 RepID=A0B7S9_METTP|nr:glycosyltransferase family 2 protein [Methanothrix thermoacetophila]ABK14753.1 glycosyl transferase, family 2 [Methanothrix thermoacetophila PT]
MSINISIVTYKSSLDLVRRVVTCSLKSNLVKKLYILDNSPTAELQELTALDYRIKYIFNNKNLGFGRAHNIAMLRSIKENVKYHLVLNPDISFHENVIDELYDYMEANPDVGLVMPKVLYPSGEIQYLCKLLPTPFDLFFRRFMPFKKLNEKRNNIYELRFTGYNKIMNVPYLSGCFMFLRTKALEDVGLFDERFFMYLEDTDLCRRIYSKYKTVFYPNVSIYHEFARGSYKSSKLLMVHIKSVIYYFNKWGWFFDRDRDKINKQVLMELNARNY